MEPKYWLVSIRTRRFPCPKPDKTIPQPLLLLFYKGLNIILQSTSMSSQWPFSLIFPNANTISIFYILYALYIPSHLDLTIACRGPIG